MVAHLVGGCVYLGCMDQNRYVRPAPEALLEELDPQQREVALQVAGPLCVRAGAGTGKTRAITYRIAYGAATGAVDPSTVLAVTFTQKAAAEMAARLRTLGASQARARTFHSAALQQLTYFWGSVFGGTRPEIAPHKASLVVPALHRVGIAPDKTLVRDLAAEIEWAKVSMVDAARYANYARQKGRTPPGDLDHDEFARVFDAYEMAKRDRGVIDFEDTLRLTCSMIEGREDVAQAVRSRYRSFVVDEYQDVSPVQQHLLDLWLGGRKDICVVGDVAQTIYSFTGASSEFLEKFPQRVKGANVVELVRDYRSTPQIVATANRIVASARGMDGRSRELGLPGAVRLVAQQPSGPGVRFEAYGTDQEEADAVAQRIKDLVTTGVAAGEIAILYRTNSQSEAFENALSNAGITFQIHGGARFFDREEVRRAVVLLRQAARIRSLTGGEAPASLEEEVSQIVSTLGWSDTAPTTEGASRDRWANLDALVSLARERENLDLEGFVRELAERIDSKAAPAVDGVVLSTLHAAKGLEWDAVFLVGCSDGLLPISLATTPEAVEEERRLLYVGVTRARKFLEISWAAARSGGRSRSRRVSRFLAPMWPKEEPAASARRGGGGTGRSGSARRKDEEETFRQQSDPETLGLYEDLRTWRTAMAASQKRRPYQVLANTTLRDIATAKPKTLRQLGLLRGIGDVKLDQYGADILRVVRESINAQSGGQVQG